MTSLRQRVLGELQRRNYSLEATRGYIHAIKQLADYFGKSPEDLDGQEIRQFLLHLLRDKKLGPGTVEGRMSAPPLSLQEDAEAPRYPRTTL